MAKNCLALGESRILFEREWTIQSSLDRLSGELLNDREQSVGKIEEGLWWQQTRGNIQQIENVAIAGVLKL